MSYVRGALAQRCRGWSPHTCTCTVTTINGLVLIIILFCFRPPTHLHIVPRVPDVLSSQDSSHRCTSVQEGRGRSQCSVRGLWPLGHTDTLRLCARVHRHDEEWSQSVRGCKMTVYSVRFWDEILVWGHRNSTCSCLNTLVALTSWWYYISTCIRETIGREASKCTPLSFIDLCLSLSYNDI